MSFEIKGLIEARATLGKQAQDVLAAADSEKRAMNAEEQAKFDKIMADYDSLTKTIDGAKKLTGEVRMVQSDLSEKQDDAASEKRAVENYLRSGSVSEGLRYDGKFYEARTAMAVGSTVVGDRPFAGLVNVMKLYSGVLAAGATVEVASDGNPSTFIVSDDTGNTGGIVGENTQLTTDTSASESNVVLLPLKYHSNWIKISTERLQDTAYDVVADIQNNAGIRIGRKFNTDSTTAASNASATAKGFVAAAQTQAAAGAAAITYSDIVNLIHKVDPAYRNSPNCKVMLHDQVLAYVRKILDTTGRPLFDFTSNTILGKPVVINNDMASAVTTGLKTMAFGDFAAYRVRLVGSPRFVRANERFVDYDQVGFWLVQRMDGALLDSKALAVLVQA